MFNQCVIIIIVDNVAVQKSLTGIQGEQWSEAVMTKLNHVGVKLVQDFVASATLINRKLAAAGH
jgi:hypothetical protein